MDVANVASAPISASSAEAAHLSSRAHAVALEGAGGCPQCAAFAVAFNTARSEAGYWRVALHKAVEREEELKRTVAELKAKLKLRERQLFGRKTERGGESKPEGAQGGQESGQGRKRGQQPGAAGHGRRRHDHLPAVEEQHELAEEEQCCGNCGLPFDKMEETEDSEQIEIEVRAHRRVIRRARYQPTCSCPQLPAIITAPPPPKLIPKGALGVSVWVLLLLDKFLFQRPTYRLLTELRLSYELDIPQGTVTGGLKHLTPLFEPLYAAIIAHNVSDTRWHADETRWMVFEEIPGKQGNKWYMWAFLSRTTVVFKLDPSRSSEVPFAHFGEEAEGILNVDRYSAYKVLLDGGRILLAFCWAHVRRDFLGVAKDWGGEHEAWGLEWVDRIAALYGKNQQRLAVLGEPEAFREAQAKLEAGVEWMADERDVQLADASLHPAHRKVLESLKRHWSGLVLFVKHPEVPMDNNRAERAQRPHVVGRKNYYGSGAVWSGELAAMLFSLFQTLLLWDVNPRRWLTDYLDTCAHNGGEVPADAEQWLPWNLNEEQRRELRVGQAPPDDTS